MRTVLHLTLTPIVFYFGALLLLGALLPGFVGVIALLAVPAGIAYGWRNRHR